MAATNLTTTIFVVVSSILIDRVGMNKTFTIGIGALAFGGLTVLLVPNIVALAFVRAIQGLGIAIIYPVASALIMYWFPPSERAYANTMFVTFAFVGTAVGFLSTSAMLTGKLGWRLILATPGVASLALMLMWILLAKDFPHMEPTVSKVRSFRNGSLARTLRMPVVWILAVALFACRSVHEAYLFFLPLFFYRDKAMALSEAAHLASFLPWSGAVGVLAFGLFARKAFLQKHLLWGSSALVLVGSGPLLWGRGPILMAGLILTGLGLSGLLPVYSTYVMSLPRFSPSLVAAFLVVINLTSHLAAFISPLAVGKLSQTSLGLKYTLALFSGVELLAIASFLYLPDIGRTRVISTEPGAFEEKRIVASDS